jgi:hypothetical protein
MWRGGFSLDGLEKEERRPDEKRSSFMEQSPAVLMELLTTISSDRFYR